jgi:mannose-6-phosphate isomerase-like protein (cupin superfamily)
MCHKLKSLPFMPVFLMLPLMLTACVGSRTGVVYKPGEILAYINWTPEEQQKDIAIRTLKTTNETSHHLIRLLTREKPHIHAEHDLTVTVIAGKAIVHLGDKIYHTQAGDVIEIPKGVPHWAENIHNPASVVYAIFNPPFDSRDYQPITP